jgi:hypothetical protein
MREILVMASLLTAAPFAIDLPRLKAIQLEAHLLRAR